MTTTNNTVHNDSAVVRDVTLDGAIIDAFQKLTPNDRIHILEEALRMLNSKK